MANFFRSVNDARETEAGSKEPPPPPKPVVAKPAVDFFKQGPVDPEKEAAKAEALKRLLRDR